MLLELASFILGVTVGSSLFFLLDMRFNTYRIFLLWLYQLEQTVRDPEKRWKAMLFVFSSIQMRRVVSPLLDDIGLEEKQKEYLEYIATKFVESAGISFHRKLLFSDIFTRK